MGQRGACARKRLFDVHGRFSLTCSARFGYGSPRGVAAPARGNRRWTGATPPFYCPNRARRRCANHICATPPGRVAPVPIIPTGRSEMTPVTGRMERMDESELYERRREALRHQALKRLRRRHSHHCPNCGYRGNCRHCPRCGEPCGREPGPGRGPHELRAHLRRLPRPAGDIVESACERCRRQLVAAHYRERADQRDGQIRLW